MAPTLIASYSVNAGSSGTSSLTTSSFTPSNGEVIVIKTVTEGTGVPTIGNVSGGSQTYTYQITDNSTASNCGIRLATTIITGSPGSMTISQAFSGTIGYRSMVVERWSGAQLAGTPATVHSFGVTAAPIATLITTADNSIVSWLNGDWNARPGTPSYRSSATEDGFHSISNRYVANYAYQTAATAGSQTLGITFPTDEQYSIAGIEIQALSVGGGGDNTAAFPWLAA